MIRAMVSGMLISVRARLVQQESERLDSRPRQPLRETLSLAEKFA
jgi:hypothetical protein